MRQAKAMSSKTKTKSTSNAELMQLLKFKVIEWEAAQYLLDEQMQQTEAVADLQEFVAELRLQKAELDRMYNELIEQQLTQEEFDTVAEESARRNCKWLRIKQKIRLLHGSNHQKFISSDTSSEEPNELRNKVVVSGTRRKQPSGMRRNTPMQDAGENAESWDEVFSSDNHDGVPSKNSHRDLQKERASVAKYNAQQQKPKENSEKQEHRSLSEDAKQVQSCPILDVNVPNQVFATLNIQAINHRTLCTGIPVQHLDFNLEQCLTISLNRLQTISIHVISNRHVICSVVKWMTHSQRQTK